MAGRVIIIKPDGTREEMRHEGKGLPELEVLQKIVGGWIEMLPGGVTFEGRVRKAFVNEEGLLRGMPANPAATGMCRLQHRLVGNMAVWVPDPKGEGGEK